MFTAKNTVPVVILIVSYCTLLPIVYFTNLFDPVQTPGLLVISILCAISLFLLFLKPTDKTLSFGSIDVAIFVYIASSAASMSVSNDMSISIFEIFKILAFFSTFKLFQFYFVNYNFTTVCTGIAISVNVIFQCVLALYQIRTGSTIMDDGSRFLGTMTHSNVFSECILFSLPFVIITLDKTTWPYKGIPLSSLILSILLIIMAQTRAVWVGSLLGAVVVAFFIVKNRQLTSIISIIKTYRTLVFISGVIFAVLSVYLIRHELHGIYDHLISLKNLDSNNRIYVWKKTLPIIKSHIFFGVGPGSWRFHQPLISNVAWIRPHNDYLWVLVESGIFALSAYISLFGLILFTIIKNLAISDKKNIVLLYPILFGVIAYCTDSFFAFPKERPYFLVLLALMFAFTFGITENKNLFKINTRLFSTIMIVISLLSTYFSWNRMTAEILNKKIINETGLGTSTKLSMLKSITPFFYASDPFSNPVNSLEGSLWLDIGNFDVAKQCYLQAYKMAPLNPYILITLGSISELSSDRQNARRYYKEVIRIDPRNSQAILNLAVIEYKDGNKTVAAELVKKVDVKSIEGQEKLVTQYKILESSLKIR